MGFKKTFLLGLSSDSEEVVSQLLASIPDDETQREDMLNEYEFYSNYWANIPGGFSLEYDCQMIKRTFEYC